ncbi:uncharacterized protein LOC127841823 isoform X2 [Dreissena polymorpha]|uniref:uncharacterized protein LOC127841823 isoform X2 n=1 Tax=Dreissena polymorpha TaxID=45954 RepID=UPI002264514B|nr:uncharacterized protein LOC127841823 isoform X2 [Dreissena polymorpha]
MVLGTFPRFQNNTRLVRYLDTLYKLKVTYNQESLKEHADYISQLTAHHEIEQCFRAVLYMNERNVNLRPIETQHFLIQIRKVMWSFPQKYTRYGFEQNGVRLKTYEFMFEFNVSLNEGSMRRSVDETKKVEGDVMPIREAQSDGMKHKSLELVSKDKAPDVPLGRFGRTKEGTLFRVVPSEKSVERFSKNSGTDLPERQKHSRNDSGKKQDSDVENNSYVAKGPSKKSINDRGQLHLAENMTKDCSFLQVSTTESKLSGRQVSEKVTQKRKQGDESSDPDDDDDCHCKSLRRPESSRQNSNPERSDLDIPSKKVTRVAKNESKETDNSFDSDVLKNGAQHQRKKSGKERKQMYQTVSEVESHARNVHQSCYVSIEKCQDATGKKKKENQKHQREARTRELAVDSSAESESDAQLEQFEDQNRRHSKRLNKSGGVHSKHEQVKTGLLGTGKEKVCDVLNDGQNESRQIHHTFSSHVYKDNVASNVSTDDSGNESSRQRSFRLETKAKESDSRNTMKIQSGFTGDADSQGSPERGRVRRSRRLEVQNTNNKVDFSPSRLRTKNISHGAGTWIPTFGFLTPGNENEEPEMSSPQVLTVKPVKRAAAGESHRPHTRQMDEESRRIEELRQQQAHRVYRDFMAKRRDRHAVEQAERAETNKLRQLYEPTVPRSPQKPGSSSQDQRSQGQEVEQQRVTRKRNSGFLGALMDNLVTPTKKFLFGSKNKE